MTPPVRRVRKKAKIVPPKGVFIEAAKVSTTHVPVPQAKDPEAWIELFPSGIAINSGLGRPLLILKDKSGNEVLPVWMHPLDAGVAMAEMQEGLGLTPHVVTRKVLEAVQLTCESCTFIELVGHHQYVQLLFRAVGDSQTEPQTLKLRADEAMSFCLQAKARFFSTTSYMTRCRALQAELGSLEEGLQNGQHSALRNEMEISSKKHPYLM
ncbi:MAG: hypothetical protein V4760_03620 [Bdellovibrionota bacterium]